MGHTIARHVGKSVDDLAEQLQRHPALLEASTFPDIVTAEQAANAAFRDSAALHTLAEQEHSLARFNVTMPEPVGVVLRRGQPPLASPHALILAGCHDGRIIVRTAYVTAHDHTLADRHPQLALLMTEYGQDYFDDHVDEAEAFLKTLFTSTFEQRAAALAQLEELAETKDDELTDRLQRLGLAISLPGDPASARSFVDRTRVRLATSVPGS